VTSLSMKGKKLPETLKLKTILRETIAYFSKPETRTHLRNAATGAPISGRQQATQKAAITLAGNIMEAHGIARDHGFAVMREVSMGKIYGHDMELRKLINMNAQRMSATCQQAMMSPDQQRQMQKMQMQMTQMQKQIMKKVEQMTPAQRQKVWAKTEPRAQQIMKKLQKMDQKKRMEYQRSMPKNEREAMMVYQIMKQQQTANVNKGMKQAMEKQRRISTEIQGRLGKMDSEQKKARLEEIRAEAEALFKELGALSKEEQLKRQGDLADEDAMLLSEWQMLTQGADLKTKLRFEVGVRVYCNVGNSWQKGTVVNTHFRDVRFTMNRLMPYQVKLDVGQVIVAPMDSDVVIRAIDGDEENPKDVAVRVVMARVSLLSLEDRKARKTELEATKAPANAAAMATMSPKEQIAYKERVGIAELTGALEYRFLSQLAQNSTKGALRFKIGTRVACNVNHKWMPGAVVALHYREPSWDLTRVVPYQIQLDAGPLIYAPLDDDSTIKALDTSVGAAAASSSPKAFSL